MFPPFAANRTISSRVGTSAGHTRAPAFPAGDVQGGGNAPRIVRDPGPNPAPLHGRDAGSLASPACETMLLVKARRPRSIRPNRISRKTGNTRAVSTRACPRAQGGRGISLRSPLSVSGACASFPLLGPRQHGSGLRTCPTSREPWSPSGSPCTPHPSCRTCATATCSGDKVTS